MLRLQYALLLSLSLAAGLLGGRGLGDEIASPTEPLEYMVLITGGELLTGAFPDGHTYFLTRSLYPLGLRCVGSITVEDRADEIQAALRFATARARLVIVTGGLGPTDNDITRETLADFTGVPLAENEEVLQGMERRTGVSRDQLRANIRRQARVPTRGGYLGNVNGSSVGLVFEREERVIVALPGPPSELQPMVRQRLVPWLAKRFGTRLPGSTLTLRFVGVGQSQVDQTMDEHAPLAKEIVQQSQFEAGRVDFTFGMPDDTPENRARLEELKAKILAHLGDYVYATGSTTLEEVVLARLRARGETLAVAESGSGGALAAALSTAEEAGTVMIGGLIAADDQRLGRLLEADQESLQAASAEDRADQLAAAAARHVPASWGLAVGQLQTAAGGASYVEVALYGPDGMTDHQRIGVRGTDAAGRTWLATRLLDMVWRKLR